MKNGGPLILDGRKAREALFPALKKKISSMHARPTLAVVQAGERVDSDAYIKAKSSFAHKIGVALKHARLAGSATEGEIVEVVKSLNEDASIHGIIVQLPLPESVDKTAVVNAIGPEKDVDALTAVRVARWSIGEGIMPATARGVKELLDFYGIAVRGKKIVVVGRSDLVGTPIALMCRNAGASGVVVCHSKTPDLAAKTREADVIAVAVGKPGLIGASHVRPGQTIVDVGISRIGGESSADPERLAGDVDFDAVAPILGSTGAISPVPGGVGPMTVLGLFENLADLCSRQA